MLFGILNCIPGHWEQPGSPFLLESTTTMPRSIINLQHGVGMSNIIVNFLWSSSCKVCFKGKCLSSVYLGSWSNVRYHNGILHVSKPRLHIRLILIQQHWYIRKFVVIKIRKSIKIKTDDKVTSKTSRPTRNIGFAFKCSTSATSSITGPLLQFIRIASC